MVHEKPVLSFDSINQEDLVAYVSMDIEDVRGTKAISGRDPEPWQEEVDNLFRIAPELVRYLAGQGNRAAIYIALRRARLLAGPGSKRIGM